MSRPSPGSLNSIKRHLFVGFAALVLLLVLAGWVGWHAITGITGETAATLESMHAEARLSARLSAAVAQEIQAATRYLDADGRDAASREAFRRLSFEAHRVQREMSKREGQTVEEIALIAAIDDKLSATEVRYALAHRLEDLGRPAAAHAVADSATALVPLLLKDVDRLSGLKARNFTEAAERLRTASNERSQWLEAIIGLALVVACGVAVRTARAIYQPLLTLIDHARELSEGNLAARTTATLPGEFQMLAGAMNQTSDSLSRVVSVAASTADDVAGSARELASVIEELASSANEAATAMGEITSGAESQVKQLRAVDDVLQTISAGADGVLASASEVSELAATIEQAAQAKRHEVARALGFLMDVRTTVQRAASEVTELNRAADTINQFVITVSRIAEQTNLLALNAAIEAARAGAAGRGFTVVADEVRKLAEQAQAAADDVVSMTAVVTSRVESTAQAMAAGVARVGEIEHLSRDIDGALGSISLAAERTREAAGGVTSAAHANRDAVAGVATSLSTIARTAEGHAATAQQVSATTEEQSAACEEMSLASNQLLDGSVRLKEIVGGLRLGETARPAPTEVAIAAD